MSRAETRKGRKEQGAKHPGEGKVRSVRRKKLLIATDAYIPRWDGIARYLAEIIPRIKNNYDISVVAPLFPGYEGYADNEAGVRVKRISSYTFRFGDYHPPKFSYRTVEEEVRKADLVWTHAIMPIGMCGILAARKHGKPVIATIHSLEWELAMNSLSRRNPFRPIAKPISKLASRHFYSKCDLLMVPDSEVGEKLLRNKVFTEKAVVRLGTDTKKFKPAKDKEEAKRRIGLSPESIVVGYVGRVGREKDIPTLIRAFRRLRTEIRNVKLVVVGDGAKDHVGMVLDQRGAHYFPNQDDVVPFYQALDIYVLPSLTETTSLSTMEAMSCGVPVVTTKVGYVKRYVKEKVNGLFFPKRNPLVLSLKLKWLIKNEEARLAMGFLARKEIEENYSWERTVSSIKKILNDFLA